MANPSSPLAIITFVDQIKAFKAPIAESKVGIIPAVIITKVHFLPTVVTPTTN
jgi:hypothetical protein